MDALVFLAQILIPAGIFNVWFLRSKRATLYRGGDAKDLKLEFVTYGLPSWMFYAVGTLKVSAAVLILAGFVVPICLTLGAALMATLMLGAVFMHAKVRDPAIRYLPATLMLVMSLSLFAKLG